MSESKRFAVGGQLLGKGTFGAVFAGTDTLSGSPMALKVVTIPPKSDDYYNSISYSCIRELEYSRFVTCYTRNVIPRFHGAEYFDESDGVMKVVMAFDMMPMTIHEYIHEVTNTINPDTIRHVMFKLMQSVQSLHELDIVHRDIKTDNVLIQTSEAGVDEHVLSVRLCDLGTARIVSSHEWDAMVTPISYAAPECVCKVVDGSTAKAADMWSVGCVMLSLIKRSSIFFASNKPVDQLISYLEFQGGMSDDANKWYADKLNKAGGNAARSFADVLCSGKRVRKRTMCSIKTLPHDLNALLYGLLDIHPITRLTAEQGLKIIENQKNNEIDERICTEDTMYCVRQRIKDVVDTLFV
jgi:serine/threonine protein kinase